MVGPSVATAVPPQIAVLIERRLASFQFILKTFLHIYPTPKEVVRVNAISIKAYFPALITCGKLSVIPARIIPARSIFLEVQLIPESKTLLRQTSGLSSIPKISAVFLRCDLVYRRICYAKDSLQFAYTVSRNEYPYVSC